MGYLVAVVSILQFVTEPIFYVSGILLSAVVAVAGWHVRTSRRHRAELLKFGMLVERMQAQKDLTLRYANTGGGLDSVGQGFNAFVGHLAETMHEGYVVSQEAAAHAKRLAESAGQPLCGYSTQSDRMAGMVANIESISTSVGSIASNVSHAETVVREVETSSLQGMNVIGTAVRLVSEIGSSVEAVTQDIALLGDRAEKITSLVEMVGGIAEQTNLLALNAAIEAARAGEQGRGFAVVADEVRKLAERTATATKEISGTVSAIQKEIYDAVFKMRRANENASAGNNFAHQADDALHQINDSIHQLVVMVHAIAESARAQSESIEGVASGVVQLATVAIESDSVSQCKQELERYRNRLSEYPQQYKL